MGPATASDAVVEKLILAGMNIARFNFSHGDYTSHKEAMDRVKRVSEKLNRPVALMLDTKGPEIRTGQVAAGGTVTINAGDIVEVSVNGEPTEAAADGKPARLSVTWRALPERVSPGIRILIADGLLELDVIRVENKTVVCSAHNTGTIGSRKNVNLIGIHAGLPIMSEQDKKDLAFGASQNVDFVAASFVSFASEIVEIRQYLESLGSRARIIAKIENEEGVDNIREIAAAADGVMVARGDLGVQLATERIPIVQKCIIAECRKAGKPVITATQMLDSMIVNPRPTRAELTDVANAIFDGTDAVMLSGETANGAYPVEAVETMSRIALTVEDSQEYCQRMREFPSPYEESGNIGFIMARNAYTTARDVKAMVIITPTLSGNTARMLSTFRPEQAVIALTPDPQVRRQLQLHWGVVPLLAGMAEDSAQMTQNAIKIALDAGVVHMFDRVILVAGIPLFSPLMVNTVRVLIVGNVLACGSSGGFINPAVTRANGHIVKANTLEEGWMFLKQHGGEILVCKKITSDLIPLLRIVDGIIAEEDSELTAEVLQAVNQNLVWLTGVHGAFKTLESGLAVTIDGAQFLVYEGTI